MVIPVFKLALQARNELSNAWFPKNSQTYIDNLTALLKKF